MKLRVFTAFSGYDSQCMALDRAGIPYELVGWSEIDKYAIQAHNAVYPQWADRNYGDICKIDWSQVPDFDFLTYSSPCQDFSTAGLQKGGEEGSGTRSSLLWECRRAIKIKRPKFLMMENVKGLVGKNFRPLFQKWLDTLQGYGYTNYWKVLNAKDYGVPQNRERVFVISVFGAHEPFRFPEGWPLPIVLQDVLEDKVDEHYYLKPEMLDRFRYNPQFLAEIERVTGEKLEAFPAKSGETVVAATAQGADAEDNGHTVDADGDGAFGIDLEDESTWLF